MKVVLSAISFAILVVGIYFVYVNLPGIQAHTACYKQLMQVYNQKGIVVKHAYMSDEQICLQSKSIVLEGLLCFRQIDVSTQAMADEGMINSTARWISRATKTPMEVVVAHNAQCNFKRTRIIYDLDSPDPFAANFE